MKSHRSSLHWRITLAMIIGVVAVASIPVKKVEARRTAAAATVVNAASYAASVAPGSIAALFSTDMTQQAGQAAVSIPLPTTLAGLSVKIGGMTAPLFYASSGQINLQVPGAVAAGNATVEVFANGSQTPISTGVVTIADASPGVFTVNQTGTLQATVLNSDYSVNANFDALPGSRPEAGGNFVVIYATGIGRTTPLVPDGQAGPSNPLANADGVTSVNIGGLAAQVLYSGLAPGFVGLWQINAVLPASLPTNLSTSLSVELKTKQSQPTTIAVASQNSLTTISGNVLSAITGGGIGGADVAFQPTPTGTLRHALTNGQGGYRLYVIGPSSFSVSASAAGYITASQTSSIGGGEQAVLPPIALTAPLAAGQYRVVIAWQNGIDLDAHLTGPGQSGTRWHVWWNGETNLVAPATAQFDRDDQTGVGPETLTFTPQANGTYRFSVQNYSNRDLNGSVGLNQAKVLVRVFLGSQQVAVVSPPSGGGTLWKVFEINNGQLTIINQLTDEPDPSNIKTAF
jgi:uncharacterized protein (TIGR03437 family)